jgi:hypothetical protein
MGKWSELMNFFRLINLIKGQNDMSSDPTWSLQSWLVHYPPDATKKSHPKERALYKKTILAVKYEMGEESRAEKIQLKFFMTANRRELVSLKELLGNQAELSMVVR